MTDHLGQLVCRLTTTSAVYFTDQALGTVASLIERGRLIAVRDDNGTEMWLNPAAVRTVQEEADA